MSSQPADSTKRHLVLDAETLAIHPHAAITEIALVDILTDATFNIVINPYEQQNQPGEPFKTDPQTVEWHLKRDPSYLILLAHSGVRSSSGATLLQQWLEVKKQETGQQLVIWCQGTDFDIPIITNFLNVFGYRPLWRHDDVRDIRTLAKLFPGVSYKKGNHSALEDATLAAQHLRKLAYSEPAVFNMLGLTVNDREE